VNHEQFTVTTLAVNGRDLPLRYGQLIVVQNTNAVDEDWECLAASSDDVELQLAPYSLDAVTTEGTTLRADAVVVRSDGRSHVFRGVGALLPL
jgi:hypothetical protein